MAGPGVNHVNVPARFSMPPARPLEANASCRLDRRQPVLSNTFGLWGPVPRPPTAPHLSRLSTTCHTEPPPGKPQGWSRRWARSHLTGTPFRANARRDVERYRTRLRGVARHECPARLPSRDTNSLPRGKLTRAVVRLENDSRYATAVTHGVPIRSRPFADCLGLFPTGARRRSGRARSGPSGSANPSRAADIHR